MHLRGLRTPILIAAALLVVVGLALVMYLYLSSRPGATEDDARPRAPEFALYGADGAQVVLSETVGRVRVLNFWASWSPYSTGELAMLERVRQAYGDRVVVLAIGRDTDRGEGKRYAQEQGLGTAPWVLFDPDDTYYLSVGGYNMPETVVLDADGRIVYHVHGPIKEEELLGAIEAAHTTQ